MFAQLTIAGRVGRDPIVKFTKTGEPYCMLSIATDGGRKDETLWISVTVFGKAAEACGQYLSKGSGIVCSGQPQVGLWNANDGPQAQLKLITHKVQFLGGGNNNQQPRYASRSQSQPPQPRQPPRHPQQQSFDTTIDAPF